MPELPEVEFAARSLRRWLADRTVQEVVAPASRIFRGTDRKALVRDLRGRRLEWIERRGKYLLIAWDRGVGLLSHLGMTGKWLRLPEHQDEATHVRAELILAEGGSVAYDDQRLFGRLTLHPAEELLDLPEIRALGPDPLIDGIDPGLLAEKFKKTSRSVKVALMDQRVLAGLGNIQTTEALFLARIHPEREARSLSPEEVERLVRAIEDTLQKTLDDIDGDLIAYVEEAGSHNPFQIYRRQGEACPRCGTTLEAMVLGGRTTVFCPRCQSL